MARFDRYLRGEFVLNGTKLEKVTELKPHTFRMELIPATSAPSQEMFNLYKEFQRDEFNEKDDELDYDSFSLFLGASNMEQDSEHKLGTFWWNWFIDEELIACSVLDILPSTIVVFVIWNEF